MSIELWVTLALFFVSTLLGSGVTAVVFTVVNRERTISLRRDLDRIEKTIGDMWKAIRKD